MKSYKEVLEKLTSLTLSCTNCDAWVEDLPEDIYNEYIDGNYKEVVCGLSVDTHRWYETSISVIKVDGFFIGVRHITNVFSESLGASDCGESVEFFRMIEVETVTYKAA